MQLTVNGAPHSFEQNPNLSQLLETLNLAGKRLAEIAALQGKPWLDAAMDLILAEEQWIGTVYFMMSEDNVKLQLEQPWLKFGTDAGGEIGRAHV